MKEQDQKSLEEMLEYIDLFPPLTQILIKKRIEDENINDLQPFKVRIVYDLGFIRYYEQSDQSYNGMSVSRTIEYNVDRFLLAKDNGYFFFNKLTSCLSFYEKLYNFQTQANEFNRQEKLKFLNTFHKIQEFDFTTITDKPTLIMLYKLGKACEEHQLNKNPTLFCDDRFLRGELMESYVSRLAPKLGITQTSSEDKSVQTESVDLLEIGTQVNTDIINLGTQTNVLNHNVATQVEPVVKEEINLMEFEPEENFPHEREQLMTEEVLEMPEPKAKGCKDKIKENCVLI